MAFDLMTGQAAFDPRAVGMNQRLTEAPERSASVAAEAGLEVDQRLGAVHKIAEELRARLEMSVLEPAIPQPAWPEKDRGAAARPASNLTMALRGYSERLNLIERVLLDIHARLQV